MNIESNRLDLLAYVDGELDPARRREVERWLAEDAEARALRDELASTRTVLAGAELERGVPASREFYWSQIERSIRAEAAREARETPVAGRGWAEVWRWVAPLAGLAAVAVVVLLPWRSGVPGRAAGGAGDDEGPVFSEVASGEIAAFDFRSESAGMTVVWVQSKIRP